MKKDIESRIAKLESILTEKENRLKPTNEIAPATVAVGRVILKNLPLIIETVMKLKDAYDNSMEDHSEESDTIQQFAELGNKIIEMTKNIK